MIQKLNWIDNLLNELQHGLKTCQLSPFTNVRPYPCSDIENTPLSDSEQQHAAGLMRVNNSGEVMAQGLYRGQAFSARDPKTSDTMLAAAEEENEHLNWCLQRLSELGGSRSKLDGIWYLSSFTIGSMVANIGDKWSLGFVEETEKQVNRHLDSHLQKLPEQDLRSRAILETMKVDEMRHAIKAHEAGAAKLPSFVKRIMGITSKVMTFVAYRT